MQFCLLSVSKKQKIMIKENTKTKDNNKDKKNASSKSRNQRQYTPRDKLIKGLGVSLAKTPFELVTPKAGTPSQIFLFLRVVALFCCIVCYGEQSTHL